MAIPRMNLMWALLILLVLCDGGVNVKAQSPAMAPSPAGTDCMTLIYNLTDCLTFVEQGSKTRKPDKGCCPELAGMLDSNPICLCNLLGKSSNLPVQLDLNKALKLPSVCHLQAPPFSLCAEVGIPVGAPVESATSSTVGSPTQSQDHSSSSGEEVAPSAGKNNGGLNAQHNNLAYLWAGLAFAFTSFFTL